jgi:hypothetical protein
MVVSVCQMAHYARRFRLRLAKKTFQKSFILWSTPELTRETKDCARKVFIFWEREHSTLENLHNISCATKKYMYMMFHKILSKKVERKWCFLMPTSTLKGNPSILYIYTMVQLEKNDNYLPSFFPLRKIRTMAYLLAPRKITGKQALTNEQNGSTSRELFQRLQGAW